MIRVGDTIENPVTGERLVFRKTSRETGGQAVVVETFVQPNGSWPRHTSTRARRSVSRSSRVHAVSRSAVEKIVAGPGQRLTVPAGTPHKFWNAGEEESAVRLRGAPCPSVRVADRDDVRAGGRRQDESQRDAEPAATRGDREFAFRHRPAPVSAGDSPADRTRNGRAAREALRLRARLHARRRRSSGDGVETRCVAV